MSQKLTALLEGSYSVDATKKFIPFEDSVHKKSDRPSSLFIHVQPFLIRTENELLVLDTGLGYNDENGEMILHQNIKKAGYNPQDVTKVLMSHLHFDHSGGMVFNNHGKLELSFPNAEYIIQRGEWETAYSGVSKSYRTEIFDVLQRSGSLNLVDGSGILTPEISYEITGGHSEFHQVFHIQTLQNHYFFGGDILPEPEQLIKKFVAKYDFDGRKALELRLMYGHQAAINDWICLFYHSNNKTFAQIGEDDNGFIIKNMNQ
jgi:glyoxylase-like metal-dependent hydrolase (beta-lactamase superfamily II)